MGEVIDMDPFNRLPERYRERAREIAARVRDIDAMLAPTEPVKIGEAVVRMFRQFLPQPGVDPADMAAEYREACKDLPEWAISEAANDFLWGRIETHTGLYMPICAQFAKHVRSILVPFYSERSALRIEASKLVERAEDDRRRHQIAIERSDPAVRQRVAALVEKATAGLPKQLSAPRAGLGEEQQGRLDALKKPRQFVSKIAETKIGKAQDANK